MGGENLFEGPTGAILLAGCDLPNANGRVVGYPPVNPTVFAFAPVLVLVIYLHHRLSSNKTNFLSLEVSKLKDLKEKKKNIYSHFKFFFFYLFL